MEPDYLSTEFYLEVDLYFSDLSNLGGPEKWQKYAGDFENKAVFKQAAN